MFTILALKQWMSSTEYTGCQSDIVCELIISEVEDANENQSTTSGRKAPSEFDDTHSNASVNSNTRRRYVSYKLLPDWALIVAHPIFQKEYKVFIRNYQYWCFLEDLISSDSVLGEQLGGHADVNGDTVVYKGSFPEEMSGMNNHTQLHETTKKFAGQFAYPVLDKIDENQMKILEDNADKAVFRRLNENEYRVIAKIDVMAELRKKLSFRPYTGPGAASRRPSTASRQADSL